MQKKITGNGNLVDIKFENNNDIKIIGFKHKEVKNEVSKIIDKARTYNFPDFWDFKPDLITGTD